MTQPKPIISGHGRWECRHGFLHTQCRCFHPGRVATVVPCASIKGHAELMIENNLCEPELDTPAPPVEPCGDHNPWGQAGGPTHRPVLPCGRPKGHDKAGGLGAQWGQGHAERPNDDDVPVKQWRQTWTSF